MSMIFTDGLPRSSLHAAINVEDSNRRAHKRLA
jgi:hypothetical protein